MSVEPLHDTAVGDLVVFHQPAPRKGWRVAVVSEVDELGYAVRARRAMQSKKIPRTGYPVYVWPADRLTEDPHVLAARFGRRMFATLDDARIALIAFNKDTPAQRTAA